MTLGDIRRGAGGGAARPSHGYGSESIPSGGLALVPHDERYRPPFRCRLARGCWRLRVWWPFPGSGASPS
jgi:hypothetical protein